MNPLIEIDSAASSPKSTHQNTSNLFPSFPSTSSQAFANTKSTHEPFRDLFEPVKPQTIQEKIDQPSTQEKAKTASVINRFDKKTRKKAKFAKATKGATGHYVISSSS
jgi:hypothetical protein